MSRKEELQRVATGLARRLCHHGSRGPCVRSITYDSLPMTTTAEFDGVKLSRLMTPPTPGTGAEGEQLYDVWMWPRFSGEGDSQEDLASEDRVLCDYVMRGETFGEQTVRLLYALSNADGARLEWDKDSIMVIHDDRAFGIIDGIVRSRFSTGAKVQVDHKAVLTRTPRVKVVGREFALLYREAHRVGDWAKEALIALHMSNPVYNFLKLASTAVPVKVPTEIQMAGFIKLLQVSEDPVASLYRRLVPDWMGRNNFNKKICNMKTRPIRPSQLVIQGFINRLTRYFYGHLNK